MRRAALPLLAVAALALSPVVMAGCPFASMFGAGGAGGALDLAAAASAHARGRELLAAPAPAVSARGAATRQCGARGRRGARRAVAPARRARRRGVARRGAAWTRDHPNERPR
jgi:hypothetical protein